MILLSRILLLLIIIVLLVFCVSNLDPVTVKILAWESMEMPLFLVMLFVFFFGFSLALVWQALRGVTSAKASRPSPAPPVTTPVEEKKMKRSWGLKKKSKDKDAKARTGVDEEPPRSTVEADQEGNGELTAADSDSEQKEK